VPQEAVDAELSRRREASRSSILERRPSRANVVVLYYRQIDGELRGLARRRTISGASARGASCPILRRRWRGARPAYDAGVDVSLPGYSPAE